MTAHSDSESKAIADTRKNTEQDRIDSTAPADTSWASFIWHSSVKYYAVLKKP